MLVELHLDLVRMPLWVDVNDPDAGIALVNMFRLARQSFDFSELPTSHLQSSVVAVLAALLAYFPFKEINEPGYSFNLVRGHVT
jgi:hypothetical protein